MLLRVITLHNKEIDQSLFMLSVLSTTDRTLLMTSTGPAVASGASMVPPSRANSIKAIGQIPQVSNGYLEHSVGKGS